MILVWVYFNGSNGIITKLSTNAFPWLKTSVPDYAILLFFIVGGILLMKAILYRAFLEPFLLGVLALAFISLNFVENNPLITIFLLVEGLF
ncbi:hypothetical protein [Alkaliphilus serpentinus]|uniref:hypothetical protein n=1 Tax=Alkaliphilus serpentinus TaxID=1482731 RepID=UPI0018656D0F|nr:hypothetical protein [Alkaliphilus serpentinus]